MLLRLYVNIFIIVFLVACGGSSSSPTPIPIPTPVSNVPIVTTVEAIAKQERPAFTAFESGHVRPLVLSPNGDTIYALNTADNRLDILTVNQDTLTLTASVTVGMEPVSLALRSTTELWVVNHLSDSISIVDVGNIPRVINTLHVGDEPRDIVFASNKAFISAAHRGQNVPFDPQLTIAGVGRADVWVFDPENLGDNMSGTPQTILTMFGDTIRGLAVNSEGTRVYAAVLNSGNQTTVISADRSNGGLDKPAPLANTVGDTAPQTGLIVKFNNTDWVDNGDPANGIAGTVRSNRINFTLPDLDVFEIDSSLEIPRVLRSIPHVGTTLFNLAVNPANGNVMISNTDARNDVRFEGEGSIATTVRGHISEHRISIINTQTNTVRVRHLNKHITSYDEALGTEFERENSLSTPTEMRFNAAGNQLYVAAFGSQKVAVFNTEALENDSFQPTTVPHIELSAGGPSGLALNESRNRLYVFTRFDNGISIVDTTNNNEIGHYQLYNPEPESLVVGRPFLYDARLTSSRGDSSCASCHIFGDMDHLAWDLGNPDGTVAANNNEYDNVIINITGRNLLFHPMKGPMTTQSLRGLRGNGPMHWRGDRSGLNRSADETLEEQAFEDFNVAFVELLGREEELGEEQMDQFAQFALQLTYPPNPIRHLDNTLTANQQRGSDLYFNTLTTGMIGPLVLATCNDCHNLNPTLNQFGTSGMMSIEGITNQEDFKIPHLRNMYQKVGMFGSTESNNNPVGDQIRGFGFSHDGSISTLSNFLSSSVFSLTNVERAQLSNFMLAIDSELAPIVGQQVSISATLNQQERTQRINLMAERASIAEPECDLIAKGIINQQARGYWMSSNSQQFQSDRVNEEQMTLAQLINLATVEGSGLTFTCTPPGSGQRLGIDRDEDGSFDRDEIDAGSDPNDSTILLTTTG